MKEQGMFRSDGDPDPVFTEVLDLHLSSVVPSLAGPKRPQDRVALPDVWSSFASVFGDRRAEQPNELRDGSVVIAAITSCTNTSNPSVMVAAGLLAKKAVEAGLQTKPWVKTSLAPGSRVVTDYLDQAGLTRTRRQGGVEAFGGQAGVEVSGFQCNTTGFDQAGKRVLEQVQRVVVFRKLRIGR